MYTPLAELASGITGDFVSGQQQANAFGEPCCPIKVIGKDSSRTTVGDEGQAASSSAPSDVPKPDMHSRADMCIFEIFDSALLGEGVLPALRDAFSRLLVPDAWVVPRGARVLTQLVSAPAARGLAGLPWSERELGGDDRKSAGAAAGRDEEKSSVKMPSSGAGSDSLPSTADGASDLAAVPPIPLHVDQLLP